IRARALNPLVIKGDQSGKDEQEVDSDVEFALDLMLNLAFSNEDSVREWVAGQIPGLYDKNPDYVGEACFNALAQLDLQLSSELSRLKVDLAKPKSDVDGSKPEIMNLNPDNESYLVEPS